LHESTFNERQNIDEGTHERHSIQWTHFQRGWKQTKMHMSAYECIL
jgi:hypothetical protein